MTSWGDGWSGDEALAGVFGVGAGFGEVGVAVVEELAEMVGGLAVGELAGEVSVEVGARGMAGGADLGLVGVGGPFAGVAVGAGGKWRHRFLSWARRWVPWGGVRG